MSEHHQIHPEHDNPKAWERITAEEFHRREQTPGAYRQVLYSWPHSPDHVVYERYLEEPGVGAVVEIDSARWIHLTRESNGWYPVGEPYLDFDPAASWAVLLGTRVERGVTVLLDGVQ